jgi:hypothetical protein
MDDNPYQPPPDPRDRRRRQALLAVAVPTVLPAAAIACCVMCSASGAVETAPMGSEPWIMALCLLIVAGTVLLSIIGWLIYQALRRRDD